MVEYDPDPNLRDTEQIPLQEAGGIDAFLEREVLPHATDAWYVESSPPSFSPKAGIQSGDVSRWHGVGGERNGGVVVGDS